LDWIKTHGGPVFAIANMKVGWVMIIEIHRDNNSRESADLKAYPCSGLCRNIAEDAR
jgi:hypothetical protein